MKGTTVCIILQAYDDRVDGIRNILGARGSITTWNRIRSGGSDISNRGETVYHLSNIVDLVDQFVPGPWKSLRKRKWIADLSLHLSW